jgi:hypothetical protein
MYSPNSVVLSHLERRCRMRVVRTCRERAISRKTNLLEVDMERPYLAGVKTGFFFAIVNLATLLNVPDRAFPLVVRPPGLSLGAAMSEHTTDRDWAFQIIKAVFRSSQRHH